MQRHTMTLTLALLLAACGSGDDGYGGAPPPAPAPPTDPFVPGTLVPQSATQTAAAATSFARVSFPPDIEALEPLEVGDAQLAVSDTEEPSD